MNCKRCLHYGSILKIYRNARIALLFMKAGCSIHAKDWRATLAMTEYCKEVIRGLKRSKKKGKEALDEALLKVAVGYSVEEVTEEYAEVDGQMKLMKRKETKKDIPPDLKAVQILLADSVVDFSKMSDEELESERDRLLAELKSKNTAVAENQTQAEPENNQEKRIAIKSVKSAAVKSKTSGKTSGKKTKKSAGKSTAKKNK